jgi:heme/copper-type cytochrome/quinol oxidase subunit 2
VQATLFWLTGGAFFALQLGMLLYLLYANPRDGLAAPEERRRRVEIIWTLVPASLLLAVICMVSGLTGSAATRSHACGDPSRVVALHGPDAARVHRDAAR